jgi:hypothetical protein
MMSCWARGDGVSAAAPALELPRLKRLQFANAEDKKGGELYPALCRETAGRGSSRILVTYATPNCGSSDMFVRSVALRGLGGHTVEAFETGLFIATRRMEVAA